MMMIFETSWEVCNKMGGIYTVLSSRANVMMQAHQKNVIFIGPWLTSEKNELPDDFEPIEPSVLKDWSPHAREALGLPVQVGHWRIPGNPTVILVDFSHLWEHRGAYYFDMWQSYGLESDKGYGDYDECCLFSIAASEVIRSVYQSLKSQQSIAIFNEWQTAMGLLYLRLQAPEVKTMFITHATTVGRSIASNGKQLYAWLDKYNGDQMAYELGVDAKHAVEKKAAHHADIFATVSQLTAQECTQLLEREPIVLPNGFEPNFVPKGKAYDVARKGARERLAQVASRLTGQTISTRDFFVSLGGRYEYRNKGIDLFVESINALRKDYDGKKKIVAFLMVPAWVSEARSDLQYLLRHPEYQGKEPLSHPTLTHWLHNMNDDATQCHLRHLGLDQVHPLVNLIFVPVYLDQHDGIMNKSYYELLVGMDLTIYPSYYEPWGYTPLESVAFGVPTITTNFAGFGLWARRMIAELEVDEGQTPVNVLERNDFNQDDIVNAISSIVKKQAKGERGTSRQLRTNAQKLSQYAEWEHFYTYYQEAYKQAFSN